MIIHLTLFSYLAENETGKTENFENPFVGSADAIRCSIGFYAGLFAYNGWNFLNFIIEEFQDPEK